MTAEELEEVARYDESRENLDRTYKLCSECDDKVNSFISDQVTMNRNAKHALMVSIFQDRSINSQRGHAVQLLDRRTSDLQRGAVCEE